MAVVFRAYDEVLGRTVALKLLAPALADDTHFRERFIRESRAVVAVDHPHIIPVYAAGEADGVLYLAMRFVPGGDLRAVLEREGPLTGERTIALLSPIASALDAAHADGLIHRDVKPANILVDARPGRPEHPYLSDFGLVKGMTASAGLTLTGQFLGTPNYVAPEQISGKPTRPQTDQYSLACVVYNLLTGVLPFARDDSMAVLWAHMYDAPPSLVAQRPDQPSAVDEVLARALAKSPEDRYGTCEELIGALRTAFGASPPSVPVAPPPEPEDDSEAAIATVTVPRLPSRAPDSGQAATGGAAGGNADAGTEPSTEDPLAQPSRKRPRGRRRALIITTTATVAVVVVGALLVAHPWVHPPVLKPTGLTVKSERTDASSTADSVQISWSGPASGPLPDQYEIFRNGIEVGTVLGTETSYTDNGLAPNTSYGFQVIAVRSGRQSPVSATLTAQTPPLQPTGLGVKSETTSSLEIAWSGPAAGPPPGQYEILRNGAVLTTTPGSITSYTDKGLAPDTAYSYQVIAVTGGKQSPASATLTSARTAKPPLSAAVLNWNGPVTEKMISINPAETGWRLQPGSSTRDNWTVSPDCSSGPCDATLTGAYDGYAITTKLTRSGSTYTGTAELKNDYYCSNKSEVYSGALTVNITVNAADTQGGVWTATSFSGHETIKIPVAFNCYATTAQLDVKSG